MKNHLRLSGVCLALVLPALALVLAGCGEVPDLVKYPGYEPRIVRFGAEVNSPYDDICPQLSPDGGELFYSSRRPFKNGEEDIERLYRSTRNNDELSKGEFIAVGKDPNVRAGAVSYDYTRNEVVFQKCGAEDGVGDCDLYLADVTPTGWINIRNLGPGVNSKEWDAHPTITRDGNTMYFASERGGDSDIWMSKRKSDGTWGTPVNVGPPINTAHDEKTPFISLDGEQLYFSSDGHPGFGGLDLFVSQWKEKIWLKPKNLGKPYNSNAEDVFLTAAPGGDTTFFASNRAGGLGEFDLYEVLLTPDPKPVTPRVVKRDPLIVRYVLRNAFTKALIPGAIALSSGIEAEKNYSVLPDAPMSETVRAGMEYTITATSPGFMNAVDNFFYPEDESGTREREILMTPVVEDERKIFSFVVEFDFDLFDIRPEEKQHLDSAALLLTQFPNSTVVASGHTDSMGTITYNINLGYSRAKEVSVYVTKYLKQKGVKLQHKPEIRTYGETEPVADNATDEGRQRNRRVEIAIIRNE